jgi:hypothetical protein
MQLSKRETRLLTSPTSLTKLGRSHVKKFRTNIYFVRHHGESSSHQLGYHGLAGWSHITIEPDANCEYSSLWGQFLHNLFFKLIYVTLIVSSNRPGDISYASCYLDCFDAIFYHQIFWLGAIQKYHPFYLSLPLSPLRKQPCLKAQTTEQWSSHAQGGCIARIAMSSPTGTEQPHKRTFTTCSTSAPTF